MTRQSRSSVSSRPLQVSHIVRLDTRGVSLENLNANAGKVGLSGLTKFSSEQGARLAALILDETANGSKVGFNFVSEGYLLTKTTEQEDSNHVADAFKWPEFDSKAWEFVAKHGIVRKAKVAIIDGGFWLNRFGIPCSIAPDSNCGEGLRATDLSDFPIVIEQFDSIIGSQFAGGTNPMTCTKNTPCPWHGNGTASVAAAALDNRYGAAGTGGQVTDLLLLKVDSSDSSITAALFNAVARGADIINLSLGGNCNRWCRIGRSHFEAYTDALDYALDSGILVVAGAGNDTLNALDWHIWPCQYSSSNGNGVYCVGALNPIFDGSNFDGSRYNAGNDGTAAPYSNYGSTVNIWAPTNIRATPNGSSRGLLTVHDGTSASAPYVAGVAAMIKAINPTLDGNGIKNIIGNGPYTAGTSGYNRPYGVDEKVGLVIRPYPAVVAAAGGYHLKPEIQITSPRDGTTILLNEFSVTFTAVVADVNDGPWPLSVAYKPNGPTPVNWTSDVDGPLSSLDETTGSGGFVNAREGPRRITATVKNSAGETSSASIRITTKAPHIPPIPVITWPPPGTTVTPGTYIVTGHARSFDPGDLGNLDCPRLVWNGSEVATPLSNTSECQAPLALAQGTQLISLSATGRFGDTATTSVSIEVKPRAGLAIQILNPVNGSTELATNGGSNIALFGNATPIPSGSITSYAWYWYRTGENPNTKKFIKPGASTTFDVTGTELCTFENVGTTQALTIELDVTNSVLSNPALSISGALQVDFKLRCTQLK